METSKTINATLELPETLEAVAESAARVLDAEASSVLLLDRQRRRLVFSAAVGDRAPMLLGEEFDAKLGVAGKVAQSGEPLLVTDVGQSEFFFKGIDARASFRTRGLVAAPMEHRGEIIGVIEVVNKRNAAFTTRDLDILCIFGNLAAASVARARAHEIVRRENVVLKQEKGAKNVMVGASTALDQVKRLVSKVAATNATVLLLGETGTGKELTARMIHESSKRGRNPFIPVNCAALPETLLESELFGHEAGAFTGATGQKIGRFELADGGTLFLDEIGDVNVATQSKLLRVLQEREFVRVGGTHAVSCDVRVIAATNRNLKESIDAGTFREDLFYRLNVFPIELPPLRSRKDDILLLATHFKMQVAAELARPVPTLSENAADLFLRYPWPGNIRELRNVIERAVLLADDGVILPEFLPRELNGGAADGGRTPVNIAAIPDFERDMIVKAMVENNWNQTRAAKALSISRDNLRYRLKKYEIQRPSR
ncbi:MAG: sigma 54-interacting transcriptional regulator [Phycisphaerae bacterium]